MKLRTLLIAFICFTAFTAAADTNGIVVVPLACEDSYGFEPACYIAWRDRELGALYNGNTIYNIFTDCPRCSTSGVATVAFSSVEAGAPLFYSGTTNPLPPQMVFVSGEASSNDFRAPAASISTSNTLPKILETIGPFGTNEVCIVHDPYIQHTIVESGNITKFLGITNWVDESLRERFLTERALGSAAGRMSELQKKGTNTFKRSASATNAVDAIAYWEYVFKHQYGVSNPLSGGIYSNAEQFVIGANATMRSNSYFGTQGGASIESTNDWEHGTGETNAPGYSSYGSGTGGQMIWTDSPPDFEDRSIIRDPNFVFFIGIPRMGQGNLDLEWWTPGGVGGEVAEFSSGTEYAKKIWINFDPVKLRIFRVIGHFIYICIIWTLFYFGVQFKIREFKESYMLYMVGEQVRATNIVGANTLLASLNPIAITAGGAKATADKVAIMIALASLGSFLVGCWYTYRAWTQSNPISNSTVASGWFHAGHSVASMLPNDKSLLASALDLAQFVVPWQFTIVLILELFVFRSIIIGFVFSAQSLRNWLDI